MYQFDDQRRWRTRGLVCFLCFLAVCAEQGEQSAGLQGKISVFVSIPPQKYFVQRIGGEFVRVDCLLPPGQSPATYEPTAKQIVALSDAKTLFSIGVPFERQIVSRLRKSLKELRISPTTDVEHSHGDSNGGDPHVWLNPMQVKEQAELICRELCLIDPDNSAGYTENLNSFRADLDRLDARIAKSLSSLRGREFYVFHPAFGHFAEAYGLRQVAIQIDGKVPSAKQMQTLLDRAKGDRVTTVFVQPQFGRRPAEAVADYINARVVTLNPLAESYVENLLDIADKIQAALSG
jgi:zinc transport system substrate-binding protein